MQSGTSKLSFHIYCGLCGSACWVRVLCSGAVGLSLINGESKEENSLGPSSSLGLKWFSLSQTSLP